MYQLLNQCSNILMASGNAVWYSNNIDNRDNPQHIFIIST
nr:MAG TPA: hypothetical protein [Caudoviricetes sp.]